LLTPVADGVFVHRSQLLRNLTVVVHGRAGALVVDPGITATELACLGDRSNTCSIWLRRYALP